MSWFLGSIIIVLLILLFNDKRKTKMIKSKLEDILREDSRERIKLGNLSRDKQELVRHINVLLDRYQSIAMDNENYKQQHRRMISDIAHDIRTPLTAIIGYVNLLRDDGLEVTREKEYVDIIHERGNALKELMEEFFQMAKLECNDVEIKTEKVNISEIIRQNIITFMKEISEKHMEPDMELGEEEIYVLADRNELRGRNESDIKQPEIWI
jgi:signal transduction histidine kinase